jgi:hypothetical protein
MGALLFLCVLWILSPRYVMEVTDDTRNDMSIGNCGGISSLLYYVSHCS